MKTVTITLRDEDQEFIEAAMKTGRYATESEAVSDAITELRARESVYPGGLEEIQSKVNVGLRELDAGAGIPWNIDEITKEGRILLGKERVS